MRRTPPPFRPSPVDGALAVALTVAAQVEIWIPAFSSGDHNGSRVVLSATTLVITSSLLFRRSAPLLAVAAACVAAGAQGLLTTPSQTVSYLLALLVLAYAGGAYTTPRHAAAAAAFLLAAIATGARDAADWTFALLVVGGAWAVGLAMRRRVTAVRALEVERDQAAAVERARIARELHDIVSHRVTTMVVQAQAAETALSLEDPAVRAALRSIDEAGRAALGELRALLGVLRGDEPALGLAPQPRLEDIESLVEEARSAGTPVELRVEGAPRKLAPGVQLTLYRIAQEALTNVTKHARRAPTQLVLRYANDAVELSVSDSGAGPTSGDGRGHGLIGMRERVSVYGGTLEAGPRGDGGFRIVATLPVGGAT